ncbi:ATP-binding cassette domain-containing protein [Nannocystaceae bacterium ST9]
MSEALVLRGVLAGYGQHTVLQDLSIEFPHASVTVVLGPGGSGKSTLLHVIEGSASELWRGGEVPRVRAWRLPQPSRTSERATPRAELALARASVEAWLAARPNLLPESQHVALFASERALVRVDRILSADAEILLLDEPDDRLDEPACRALTTILRALARQGSTIIVVTHNLALVQQVADHVVLLVDGVKLDEGEPTRVRSQPASPRVRDFFTWGT